MTEHKPTYKTKLLPTIQTSDRLKSAVVAYWTDDRANLVDVPLDSDEWFTWLARGESFRLTYSRAGRSVSFNVLGERRGNRLYWAGYKNVGGRLHKKYLGTTVKISQEKLNDAGRHFLDLATDHAAADPTAPLVEALVIYEDLVKHLMGHLPGGLRRYARSEMGRVKDIVGNG